VVGVTCSEIAGMSKNNFGKVEMHGFLTISLFNIRYHLYRPSAQAVSLPLSAILTITTATSHHPSPTTPCTTTTTIIAIFVVVRRFAQQ